MCQELVQSRVYFREATPFVIATTGDEKYHAIGIARVGRGDFYSLTKGKEIAKGRALKALTLANKGKRISQHNIMKMGYSRIQKKDKNV